MFSPDWTLISASVADHSGSHVLEAWDSLKLLSIYFDLCVDAPAVVSQLDLLSTDLHAVDTTWTKRKHTDNRDGHIGEKLNSSNHRSKSDPLFRAHFTLYFKITEKNEVELTENAKKNKGRGENRHSVYILTYTPGFRERTFDS